MKHIIAAATIAAGMFAASGASAVVTAYTDKAAFLAAAGSTQTESFTTAPVGNFASVGGVYNQSFDGFSVTGQNGGNYVGIATGSTSSSGPNYAIPSSFTGQNYFQWANLGETRSGNQITLTINLNQATTAFGFDWFNTDFSDQYTLTLAGTGGTYQAPPFTVANGGATTGFFGLISDTTFTSATIANAFNGGYISDEGFDNLITNGRGSSNPTAGAVPEPASWAMMVGGFGLIGGAVRRRRNVAALA